MKANHRISVLLIASALSSSAGAQQDRPTRTLSTVSPPRAFVENRGQWANGSLFQMRRGNSVVAVQRDGFTIQMLRIDRASGDRESGAGGDPVAVSGWNLGLTFLGASDLARVEGDDELPGAYNYLRGDDPAQWVTRVRGYSRVRIAELYPGIDLDLYERDGVLEYDLVLAPGANPAQIEVEVRGVHAVEPGAGGVLLLRTPRQDVIHSEAVCLVEDELASGGAVKAVFRATSAKTFSVDVIGWDGHRRLTVDPALLYSTCLGGSNTEEPFALAASHEYTFVGGKALSLDFPLTPGAIQVNQMGLGDAYVTALAGDGSALVYSTLLGGVEQDNTQDLVIGSDGMAIAVGFASPGFPVTPGAFDVAHGGLGQGDAFVAKVSDDGTSLIFSTYLGGSDDNDPASRVTLAADGTIYVAGLTESSDFPTTPNAYASTLLGNVLLRPLNS